MNKKVLYSIIALLVFTVVIVFTLNALFNIFNETRSVDSGSGPGHEYVKNKNIFDIWGKWGTFSFYTVQVSWVFVIYYIGKIFNLKWINKNTDGVIVNWAIIMFVVYWTLIAPFEPWGQAIGYDIFNFLIHSIIPIILITDYIFINRHQNIDWSLKKFICMSFTYPLIYYCFAMLVYISSLGDGVIYPFIDYKNPLQWNIKSMSLIVIVNILVIVILLILLAGLFWLTYILKMQSQKRRIR